MDRIYVNQNGVHCRLLGKGNEYTSSIDRQ